MFLAHPPRLIVFDLDGTLIDSRVDLSNAVNAMLAHFGKPQLPQPVIASYLGDGVSMLVRRALGDPEGDIHDEEYVTEALTFFLDYYRIHKLDFTFVYPYAIESIEAIRDAYPATLMAILTNKPVNPSREICDHLGLSRFFFQNYGGNSFHTKKPDPHGLMTLIAEASQLVGETITAAQTIMVGDSDIDILTARSCGASSIGCTFGFAPHTLPAAQPTYLAHSPKDWPQILGVKPQSISSTKTT
jgi:phosphoglycolate phosphatase